MSKQQSSMDKDVAIQDQQSEYRSAITSEPDAQVLFFGQRSVMPIVILLSASMTESPSNSSSYSTSTECLYPSSNSITTTSYPSTTESTISTTSTVTPATRTAPIHSSLVEDSAIGLSSPVNLPSTAVFNSTLGGVDIVAEALELGLVGHNCSMYEG